MIPNSLVVTARYESIVLPIVRMSIHAGSVSKRRRIGSRNVYRSTAQILVFARKTHSEIRKG